MQRGRLLILIGLVLLLATGGLFLFLTFIGGGLFGGGGGVAEDAAPTPIPLDTVTVAIALQPIALGEELTPEMWTEGSPQQRITLVPWPAIRQPANAILSTDTLNEFENYRVRYDIAQGEPILTSMLVENLYDTSRFGSTVAEMIAPGQVGMTIPANRLSAVNFGLEPGDHINVLVTFTLVDVDEDFQAVLPNVSQPVTFIGPDGLPLSGEDEDDGGGGSQAQGQVEVGRLDNASLAPFTVYVIPSESQRPKLVTQQIVQDAIVLQVGNANPFEPTPVPTAETATTGNEATPTPIPPPDTITIAVSPDDSLALNYFLFSGAKFTFTLRSPADRDLVDTVSYSLATVLERYNIEVPLNLPYATTPRIDRPIAPILANESQEPIFVQIPEVDAICIGANCP